MASLLALGGTCTWFRDRVSDALTKERNAILRHYWVYTQDLLDYLKWTQAVISGEAALAFIARNRGLLTDALEICVKNSCSEDLLSWFDQHKAVSRAISYEEWPPLDDRRPTVYVFNSPTGRTIRVICSHTLSPLTPITTYPTTALFNYFDAYSFGSAYRDLTMNRRAVVPDLPYLNDEDAERVARITELGGFEQSQWPAVVAFPPVPFVLHDALGGWGLPDHEQLMNTTCLRARHQCPGQTRFFGDAGSMVEFFAPDMIDHGVMAHLGFTPYGTTAVWRMPSGECDLNCAGGDYVLRESASETSVLLQPLSYGPFTTAIKGRIVVGESEHQ